MSVRIYQVWLIVSVLLAASQSTQNYEPLSWSRLNGGRPLQSYIPPGAADTYPPEAAMGAAEYTDDERSNVQMKPEERQDDGGWAVQPSQQPATVAESAATKSPYVVVPEWPSPSSKPLGQVAAVCFDQEGNVVVFHRGDHVWNAQSFLPNDVYNQKERGPVEANTIVTFHAGTGDMLHEWGANLFYMPHGLTVDSQSNVWVTDVALHQVFKFAPKGGNGHPLLSLGARFEPGNDDKHFCKPSGIAVTSGGDFFVSDGYCNHRIIKYDSQGNKLLQWGRRMLEYGDPSKPPPEYAFAIPHALALAEDKGIVCVADRENGRIQCFNMLNGTFISIIKLPEFGSKLFSVAYSPTQGGLLYAVNGEDYVTRGLAVRGFVLGLMSRQLVAEFSPISEGFRTPHDIAVSADGKQIFVVQLDPHKVWKFVEKGSENLSQFPVNRLKVVQPNTTGSSVALPSPSTTSVTALNQMAQDALKSAPHTLLPSLEPTPHLMSLSVQILVAASAILALTMVAVMLVFVRRKGPWCSYWLCYKRWQFRRGTSSDGFKLGSLLDPHSGFEQVCTEMSDEEEIDAVASGSSSTERKEFRSTDALVPHA